MAFQRLEYTKSWRDPADFPTYEPDETQVREDLQCLHDEARDGINRVVDALNGPQAAENLPFDPRSGLEADNVQAAIEEVYEAVQDAAAGQIVNGSVTKEKLSEELLSRAYGGRVWVAMDVPGQAHDPESGFPVGQQWLRPGFAVENLDTKTWSAAACSAEVTEYGLILTGDGSMAAASAAQSLTGAGQAGDRVLVYLQVAERDGQLENLSLHLNGAEQPLDSGVYETAVNEQGAVELVVTARWPAAALAVGTVVLDKLTVVNVSAAERAVEHCRPMEDWTAFLTEHAPFAVCTMERLGFIQTAPGQWAQVDQPVLPVSMGGTGLEQVSPGELLIGGEAVMERLAVPEADSVLRFQDGRPRWVTREQTAADLLVPGIAQGTYTGNSAVRTIDLPIKPVLLLVAKVGTGETPAVLLQEGSCQEEFLAGYDSEAGGYPLYYAGVKLSGSSLLTWLDASDNALEHGARANYLNQSGVTYQWAAVGEGGSV